MPELARFFGIVIRMFVEVGEPHHRAHVHAYYQEHAAVFAIDTLEVLGGELPQGAAAAGRGLGGDSPRRIGARLGALAVRPTSRQDRTTQVAI